mgnify:CR=1 FL=1
MLVTEIDYPVVIATIVRHDATNFENILAGKEPVKEPSTQRHLHTALLYAIQNATARLAELDTVAVDTRARMTYQDGNQSYNWDSYRASLLSQIEKFRAGLDDLYKANQTVEGPFEVVAPASGYLLTGCI